MAGITTCPSCAKQNRIPSTGSGKPACGACRAPLPWVLDATDASFEDAIAATVPVLIDLWAPWCGPCRMVSPLLEDLARQRPGQLKIVKVNVDDSPGIAARYQVQGIPPCCCSTTASSPPARPARSPPTPSPHGSTRTRPPPPEPADHKENDMRRTLTAVAALTATVAMLVAATAAPAAAHPQRTTYTITSTTPAGPTPHFPAFDPTSGHVLVSNVSANTVTDLEIDAGPARTFATGTTPHTVVVDDATRRAFVTNKGSATVSVIDLDAGTVTSLAVGPNPHGLAVDTDYRRLYVTSIDADRLEVYDLATLAPITTVPVGDGPWGVSVGPARIAVTDTAADTVHLLDRNSLHVRDVVTVGAGPWNSSFLGGTLYVTLERTGEVVAVRGSRVAWRAPVGASPHGIVADHQRNTVLAAVTGTNTIAVLDARRGTVVQTVPVAAGPAGMAITPDGRVLVGNQQAGVVTELTPRRHG